MKRYLLPLMILGLLSCEKKEIPVKKPATSANIVSVAMGGDYANQLFFSLSERKVISQNHREKWDLGFESGVDGFHVILNSSKMMGVYKTNQTSLSEVTSAVDVAWYWDMPSGNLDSTVIGNWRTHQNVYIIDRGVGVAASNLGKVKMKILSVNDNEYVIEWAELSSSTSTVSTVTKNSQGSFTYFSFNEGGKTLIIEPPKATWDLCFTTYTHVYPDHMPYLVTGVLSNRYGVKVSPISKSFESIAYTDYVSATFPNRINTIGFDWKVYDFDLSIYTVDMNKSFLIETAEGRIFKLHFLDFYDETGAKGAPSMELQELIP